MKIQGTKCPQYSVSFPNDRSYQFLKLMTNKNLINIVIFLNSMRYLLLEI